MSYENLTSILVEMSNKLGHVEQYTEETARNYEELADTQKEILDRVRVIEKEIPEGHSKVHELWDLRLKTAKEYDEFFHTARCYLYYAIGTRTGRAALAVILIVVLWVAGAKETATTLLKKLIGNWAPS